MSDEYKIGSYRTGQRCGIDHNKETKEDCFYYHEEKQMGGNNSVLCKELWYW